MNSATSQDAEPAAVTGHPDSGEECVGKPKAGDRRLRLPIAVALVGGVALLLVIAVGSVLAVSQVSARRITLELLADNADVGLELLEARIRGQLDPAHELGLRIAAMIEDGTISATNQQQITDTFRGALAAVPQATALIFIDSSYQSIQYPPSVGNLDEVLRGSQFAAGLQGMLDTHSGMEQMLSSARSMTADFVWMAPVWVQSLKQPVLFLEVPVGREETFGGVVLVVVALGELSQFLKELEEQDEARGFVLYDMDRVLSHPMLFDTMLEVGEDANEVPLPEVTMFSDPALAFRDQGESAILDLGNAMHRYSDAYSVGEELVIVSELADFGPWQIGLKFPLSVIEGELDRVRLVAIAGLVILAVAVVLGLLLGRALTRQIGGLADAATALTTLDIANVRKVPDSRFRELANAAQAFNTMTAGLRWFETYVPKSLVLRLIRQGEDGAAGTEERTLTVMFTDIRGFSTLAEHSPATDVAALLNRHFEMLTACIEAGGGTVDKFIGDSVMAFWGAPEPAGDHAQRALAAAQAIQQAVVADNAQRRAAGEPPVGVRIGIHTGPVVVGNIGSKARVNYTVVGDTVNTAARLEALAKDVGPNDDCVVLLSAETARGAEDVRMLEGLGSRSIRGRVGSVEVYRLINGTETSA